METLHRFPRITDIPARQRVLVFASDIDSGEVCAASRTLYRYGDGGLTKVREEHLDAGCSYAR